MLPENLSSQTIVAFIADIFERRGGEEYLGEEVTMAEHMLQGATIAEQNGNEDGSEIINIVEEFNHIRTLSQLHTQDESLAPTTHANGRPQPGRAIPASRRHISLFSRPR